MTALLLLLLFLFIVGNGKSRHTLWLIELQFKAADVAAAAAITKVKVI